MSDDKTNYKSKDTTDKGRAKRRDMIASINERISAIKKSIAKRMEKTKNQKKETK